MDGLGWDTAPTPIVSLFSLVRDHAPDLLPEFERMVERSKVGRCVQFIELVALFLNSLPPETVLRATGVAEEDMADPRNYPKHVMRLLRSTKIFLLDNSGRRSALDWPGMELYERYDALAGQAIPSIRRTDAQIATAKTCLRFFHTLCKALCAELAPTG